MDLVIRKARADDAGGIVAIFNRIVEAGRYTAFVDSFTVEEERAFIDNLPPRSIFHVALQGPQEIVVGFQTVTPFQTGPGTYTEAFDHVATIGTYVDLAHHRQGIASALFEATFVEARALGYEKFFTYVRADNVSGLAAYLSHGFRIVGSAQKQAKIHGRYVDEIIVEKLLTE